MYVLRDISLLRYQRLHLHKPSKEQLDVARQNETLLFLEPLFRICTSPERKWSPTTSFLQPGPHDVAVISSPIPLKFVSSRSQVEIVPT